MKKLEDLEAKTKRPLAVEIITKGISTFQIIPTTAPFLTIGSHENSDVLVTDQGVSRSHCRVNFQYWFHGQRKQTLSLLRTVLEKIPVSLPPDVCGLISEFAYTYPFIGLEDLGSVEGTKVLLPKGRVLNWFPSNQIFFGSIILKRQASYVAKLSPFVDLKDTFCFWTKETSRDGKSDLVILPLTLEDEARITKKIAIIFPSGLKRKAFPFPSIPWENEQKKLDLPLQIRFVAGDLWELVFISDPIHKDESCFTLLSRTDIARRFFNEDFSFRVGHTTLVLHKWNV